ncbi:MAG TPA: hypothetical protein VM659_11950 [Dongiaceae bacterium]|nr:hypothetical protein [Dongiaceae bacterium]
MKYAALAFGLTAFVLGSLAATQAVARDTPYHLKIADVRGDPRYSGAVPADVQFFFADQTSGAVSKDLGEFVTNRKTNSVGRPDEEVCRWAMISALKELAERAKTEGGDAVVDIVSYYRKNVFSSITEYECHAGNIVAGVALKGRVVKLAK